jgi:valyl-tRNA synthetase
LHCTAKKEAKRLEKETKLAAKTAKAAALTPAGEKRAKEKIAKSEDAPFVNTTPRGKKKGAFTHMLQSADLIQIL